MRTLLLRLLLANLVMVSCARHVVVERTTGRVDSARSITSRSDTQWNVQHEPAPAGDKNR